MKAQARPYMAVVANGFVRRVGVGLAGPEWCLIPAGGKWKSESDGERVRGPLSLSLGSPVSSVGDWSRPVI